MSSSGYGLTLNGQPVILSHPAIEELRVRGGEINSITMPLGATKWTHAQFLMDAKSLKKAVAAQSSGAATISANFPGQQNTPPASLSLSSLTLDHVETVINRGNIAGALYIVHVCDVRRYKQATTLQNVGGVPPIWTTVPGARNLWVASALATATAAPTTIQAAVSQCVGALGFQNSFSSTMTEADDMWGAYSQEPAAGILDRICRMTANVVCPDLTVRPLSGDPLKAQLDYSSGGDLSQAVMSGGRIGDGGYPGAQGQIPGSVNVLFPLAGNGGYTTPNPLSVDPYSVYSVNVAAPSGLTSNANYTETLNDNTWIFGTSDSGSVVVPSAQITIATARAALVAASYYARFQYRTGYWRVMGWVSPSGLTANIRLKFDEQGRPVTDIWRDPEDISGSVPLRHRPLHANGGIFVSYSCEGVARVSSQAPNVVFPVLLKPATGGAQGTATAPATWTYYVYAINDKNLTTALGGGGTFSPPTRPNGAMVQSASGTVGLACYGVTGPAGVGLILISAGEVPVTATC